MCWWDEICFFCLIAFFQSNNFIYIFTSTPFLNESEKIILFNAPEMACTNDVFVHCVIILCVLADLTAPIKAL